MSGWWLYRLAALVILVNLIFLLLYNVLITRIDQQDQVGDSRSQPLSIDRSEAAVFGQLPRTFRQISVEIWSKAAIGQYLWKNILKGVITKRHPNDLYIEGDAQIRNVTFRFRSGPSLKVASLLSFSVENLILVVNWRNQAKVNYSINWLEAVAANQVIRNIGIIALGNEQCHNGWALRYLASDQRIKFLFVVYDWSQVDQRVIFQWPLGVATYRDFPSNELSSIVPTASRPYTCNFIGTIYENSSRKVLNNIFKTNDELRKLCLVKTRSEWQAHESEHSLQYYVSALQLSELTLCPIGMNHECYRILEAVEYGSTPVVEINQAHVRKGDCDQSNVLRLFRQLNAPFIYVHNWTTELPDLLRMYTSKSDTEKAHQRVQLIKWYHRFKSKIRNQLIDVIHSNFV